MRAIQLRIDPFELISTLEWSCIKEIGEHGVLRVKGLISEKNRDRYRNQATSEIWVSGKAIAENDEEVILFNGVVTNLTIHSEHELHTMEIEVKTGTFLLDESLHTRAFQDGSVSCESVIETCVKPAGGRVMMRGQNNASIGGFLLQYRETNWSFVKKLSRRLGLPILPEFRTQGRRFYLGLNDQAKVVEMVANNYSVSRSSKSQGSYQVNSREIYELGQSVLFDGKQLIIGKVDSGLRGEELWHEYTLFASAPIATVVPDHLRFTGLSLRARVTKVARDRVQVRILDVENREDQGQRWFDYATVYSTPDGMGWYALPDAGDEVRLIFPGANEARAYVASSVHLSTEGGRTNPDHKSWKNKQNMEVLMTPNEIVVRTSKGQLLELSDSKGVTINSSQAIDISSDKQIRVNSGSIVNLSGQDQVSVQQKASRIHMKDAIDISGGKINMN